MPHDSSCIHYLLTGGRALQVEKGEPFDYCTNDDEDAETDYWDYEDSLDPTWEDAPGNST